MKEPRNEQPRTGDFEGLCWMTIEETEKLVSLIHTLDQVLEIGTASGSTASILARERPHAFFTCLDIFRIEPGEPRMPSGEERIVHWLKNKQQNMTLWVGSAFDLLRLNPRLKFNVTIVDGGHDLICCHTDLVMAEHLTAADGTIVCHDYNEMNWPGVTKAIDLFCDQHHWRVVDLVHTLAVLRKT